MVERFMIVSFLLENHYIPQYYRGRAEFVLV